MKRKIGLSVVFVIVIAYAVGLYNDYNAVQILLKSHVFTSGKITRCKFLSKTGGALNMYYEYSVNGQVFTDFNRTQIDFSDCEQYFLSRSFPVIYNPNEKDFSVILIFPQNFKRYGYSFPDSLKWVLKYGEK
ncbi:MAG: hypothetical protein J0L80_16870 [Chitinophagales bacterium]|nr:hypothetical protein [Chitinophagales bacterium]